MISKKSSEEYKIRVKGVLESENPDSEDKELITFGDYEYDAQTGNYLISYNESEIFGFENCKITIRGYGKEKVIIERRGSVSSDLVIEHGKRNICNYETVYGGLTIGIEGKDFDLDINSDGGNLRFRYNVDINAMSAYSNVIDISIKKINMEE